MKERHGIKEREAWNQKKRGMESKGRRVYMTKINLMVSRPGQDVLCDSDAFPCAVCRSGVRENSIQCSQCNLWVHKKCSDVGGKLEVNPDAVTRLDPLIADQSPM
jgi:hypothetical protein